MSVRDCLDNDVGLMLVRDWLGVDVVHDWLDYHVCLVMSVLDWLDVDVGLMMSACD